MLLRQQWAYVATFIIVVGKKRGLIHVVLVAILELQQWLANSATQIKKLEGKTFL